MFGNWKTRGLALILALATWFSAYREMTSTFEPEGVQIRISPPKNGWVLGIEDEQGNPVPLVRLKLQGPRGQRIDPGALEIRKRIEFEKDTDQPVTITFEITEDLVTGLPAKFRLLEASPRRVRVRLDRAHQVRLEAAPFRATQPGEPEGAGYLEGKPAEGFAVKRASPFPRQLLINGPRSVLAKASSIRLRPVNIDRLGAGRQTLAAQIVDQLDGVTVNSASSVTIDVEIAEEPADATFKVPITLIQSPEYARDFEAEPQEKQAEVLVKGPTSLITELKSKPELLLVVIDIASMRGADREPVDDTDLEYPCQLVVQFRPGFTGASLVSTTIVKPEPKPETLVKFRKRK